MLSNLGSYERQVYSQGGEDGVLEHLFECIGTTNRYFVEFGAWDGRVLSNTAHLRLDLGWKGLLMEGSEQRRTEGVEQEMVRADNIEALFRKYGVPESFDLLSIDIDGNDYWIWRALESHRPRIVVIEYNIFFGTEVSKTMPYDAEHMWQGEGMFHGASLAALRKLGREKGYSLVHTDSYTPNAFFVATEVLPAGYCERTLEELSAWIWEDTQAEPPIPDGSAWQAV